MLRENKFSIYAILVIALVSLGGAFTSVFFSKKICDQYYSVQTYMPDHIGGMVHYAELHDRLKNESRITVALDELKSNPHDPAVSIPLILFCPELLSARTGHLAIVFPFLFLFLFLMGYYLFKKGSGMLYIIAVLLTYSTSLVLMSTYFGLCFHLPDNIPSYPLAVSALCLMLWHEEKKILWLIGFAMLLAFSVMCRYIFSVYAFIVFTPVLIYILHGRFKETKKIIPSVIVPVLVTGVVVFLFSGYFLIHHFRYNYEYYSYWSGMTRVTMHFSFMESLRAFVKNYLGFFGLIHTLILFLIALFVLYVFLKTSLQKRIEMLVLSWYFFALPVYWVVVLGTNGDIISGAFMSAFPMMFTGIFCLCRPLENLSFRKYEKYISACILALCLVSFPRSYNKIKKSAQEVNADGAALKYLAVNMSDIIYSNQSTHKSIVAADFIDRYDTYSVMSASLESLYRYGFFFKTKGIDDFAPGEMKDDPELTDNRKNEIFNSVISMSAVVITYSDSAEIKNDKNILATEIKKYISGRMKNQEGWIRKDITSGFGNFSVYMSPQQGFRN